MTDAAPANLTVEAPPTTKSRVSFESISPTMAIAVGVIALCAGVWIGFKLSGGQVAEQGPCRDCDERAREAAILNSETVDTE